MSVEDKFGERHWIPACAGMTFDKPIVPKTIIPAQAGIHDDAGSEFAQTGVRPKAVG